VAFYKDNRLAGWRENFVFKLPTGQLVAAYTDATPLKRSEAKLKTIFESSGDALLVVDASGTVLEANRSSEILFAMRRTKLLGSSLPAVVIESRRDSFRSLLRNIREGSTAGTEVEILQNGVPEPVPVEFMCAVIDWEDGKAVLLNGRSLAWRRRMEQQIEQIQRMESIATLAGGIAHDFNNALAGILNCVNLAEIYLVKEPEKTREKLRTAESAIMDATALTKQLLTFARGGEPVRRVERIEPLLRNAIELSLSGSGVRAEQSFDIGLWPLAIDHGQMMQVFQNILINARQALADKGIVRIKARNVEVTPNDNPLPSQLLHGPYVVVSIADHGPGIAPEFMSRLFDPFFSTKQTGSGLGLTTAYSIIQKHDGGIVVDSEPAKGTQFSIYLPAAPDGILPESEKARTTNGKGRRILVMDDEPIVREVLCEILRHLGYRAVEAPDGESAVSLFRDARERGEPFDAVILDLVIPGGRGGEEILAVLRSIDPTIRAVATSGYSNASVLTNFLDHGFSEAFQKPSTAEEIAGILAKTFND
jgi:PAS domain S-box-containing protein